METVERNWARNVVYGAVRIAHPRSVEAAQQVVAEADRVHALGTRHSFNDVGDGPGTLVALDRVPMDLEIDAVARTATVGAGVRTGELGRLLHERGWALHNLASLPHISVAGALATGTHGSGDALGTLATAVRGLQIIGPDGQLRTLRQGDPDFAGSVVALGALGIVARVTLAIEPTYDVRQDAYAGMRWDTLLDDLDAVTGSAYSVSLFTDWCGDRVQRVLLKSRGTTPPDELLGAPRTEEAPEVGDQGLPVRDTQRGGVPGPWWDRLPHFRLEATPSTGEELQSEYLVPRTAAVAALRAVREIGDRVAPALHISELRTVAADDLWLSGAYGADAIAIAFTWRDRPDLVLPLLEPLEQRLLPLGARPHWGKIYAAEGIRLRDHYPRWQEFEALRDRTDPARKFGNAALTRIFGS